MTYEIKKDILLSGWGWAFDDQMDETLMVSRFGNVIIRSSDNIYRIIPEDSEVKLLCKVCDADATLSHQAFMNDWNMDEWFNAAVGALGQMPPGLIIGFKCPRSLGGADSADNMYFADPKDYLLGMGQIARQIADVPDGGEIVIRVK